MPKRKRRRDEEDDDEEREYGEKWEPDKGEELSGTVVRIDKMTVEGSDGPFTGRVVEIEDDEGDTWSVWCGSVLRKKLYSQVEEDDYVTITYKGRSKKGPKQFRKQLYDVVIEGADDDDEDEEDDD